MFNEPLTWQCHICSKTRPDSAISVITKPLVIGGKLMGDQNIRYCNDNPTCRMKAKEYLHIKEIQ